MTQDEFVSIFREAAERASGQQLPDDMALDVELSVIELDSLAQLEIVCDLENQLQISLSDQDLGAIKTPRDLYEAVGRELAGSDA